jgi:hypothetical protein
MEDRIVERHVLDRHVARRADRDKNHDSGDAAQDAARGGIHRARAAARTESARPFSSAIESALATAYSARLGRRSRRKPPQRGIRGYNIAFAQATFQKLAKARMLFDQPINQIVIFFHRTS